MLEGAGFIRLAIELSELGFEFGNRCLGFIELGLEGVVLLVDLRLEVIDRVVAGIAFAGRGLEMGFAPREAGGEFLRELGEFSMGFMVAGVTDLALTVELNALAFERLPYSWKVPDMRFLECIRNLITRDDEG